MVQHAEVICTHNATIEDKDWLGFNYKQIYNNEKAH